MQLFPSHLKFALLLPCLITLTLLVGSRGAETQMSVSVMKGGKSGSRTLAFSPDGKTLAGSEYFNKKQMMAVMLWDLKTAKVKKTLKMPHQVRALAFSPDGKTFATGSGSQFHGYIKLWDAQTGKLKRNLASGYFTPDNRHRGIDPVWSLAFSPNGKTIAMGTILEGEYTSGGGASLLDARTGKTVRRLKIPDHGVTALAFSPGGRIIAVSCDDGRIHLCSARTGNVIRTTGKQSGDIKAVRFTPNSKYIVTAAEDQTVKIWNVKTGAVIRTIKKVGGAYRTPPHGFAISKDATIIAVGGEEPVVRLSRIK